MLLKTETAGVKIENMKCFSGARSLLQPWLPLFVLAGLLLIAWIATPGKTAWLPGCPLHLLTGLQCPGCGSTRAFHALTHGDVLAALRMNLLAIAAIPLLVVGTCSQVWHTRRGMPYRSILYHPTVGWTITAIIITYGLLRNLPWWPFSLLAPH